MNRFINTIRILGLVILCYMPVSLACALESTTYDSVYNFAEVVQQDKKPKVLMLFATWCSGCKGKFPAFVKLADKTPDVSFYGISFDNQEDSLANYLNRFSNSQSNLNVAYFSKATPMDYRVLCSILKIDFDGKIPFVVKLDEQNNVIEQG